MVCKNCLLYVSGKLYPVDLLVLPLYKMSTILCMDWLLTHREVLDCKEKIGYSRPINSTYDIIESR